MQVYKDIFSCRRQVRRGNSGVIPRLTTDEIDHLRQAVAVNVNAGKAAVIADAYTNAAADTTASVVDTTAQDTAAQAQAETEAKAAAYKLAKLTAAAAALGITITSDMDATAIQTAITAAVAA